MQKPVIFLLLFLSFELSGQAFMRPFDNAAALSLGGATAALPVFTAGFANEAMLGRGEKLAFFASSALPYGINGWQTGQFQALVGIDKFSAAGLSIDHSSAAGYTEQAFKLSYGRRLGDNFYIGGSGLLARTSADEYGGATAFNFSLGALVEVLPHFWIGAQALNPLQLKVENVLTPSILRIGAAWQASNRLILSAEAEKDLERETKLKAGAEYKPAERVFVRLGARGGQAGRLGLGIGFQLKNGLRLDAGAEWHNALGVTPAFMLSWQKPSE